MVDAPKNKPTICTGAIHSPCASFDLYPDCETANPDEVYVGKKRLMLKQFPGKPVPTVLTMKPTDAPEAGAYPLSLEDVRYLLDDVDTWGKTGKTWLEEKGYVGVCRSAPRNANPMYDLFAYRGKLGRNGTILLFNDYNRSFHGENIDRTPFTLSRREAEGLIEALEIDEYDMPCKKGACVKEDDKGFFADGKYFFTKDPERLGDMIERLADRNVRIDGLLDDRRKELLEHLRGVMKKAMKGRELAQQQSDFYNQTARNSNIQMLTSALLVFFIGYHPMKDIIAWMRGRVKTTDFSEIVGNRIKADAAYDIKGRDAEASQAWKMTDTTRYRHLIFDAPTGEGKDVVVEKMIIMKEKGDQAVPKRFRDAKVFKVNAAEFQAGTMYRGNVADKVAEIAKAARKGPVIFYMSEIDLIFLSGGSISGDSEAVGKLLLDLIEDPAIKENLILIGTTSRGAKMLEKYPDLQRRFNWPKIHAFTLKEVADVIDGPTRASYEKSFEVKIDRRVIDAAAELAETHYRPATVQMNQGVAMPRFDAVKTILEDAAKLARDSGEKDVTIEHAIKATEARIAQSLDRAMVAKELASLFDPAETMQAGAEKAVEASTTEAAKGDVAAPVAPSSMEAEIVSRWRELPRESRDRIVQGAMWFGRGKFVEIGTERIPLAWVEKQRLELERGHDSVVQALHEGYVSELLSKIDEGSLKLITKLTLPGAEPIIAEALRAYEDLSHDERVALGAEAYKKLERMLPTLDGENIPVSWFRERLEKAVEAKAAGGVAPTSVKPEATEPKPEARPAAVAPEPKVELPGLSVRELEQMDAEILKEWNGLSKGEKKLLRKQALSSGGRFDVIKGVQVPEAWRRKRAEMLESGKLAGGKDAVKGVEKGKDEANKAEQKKPAADAAKNAGK